jgi:hypothetical protein
MERPELAVSFSLKSKRDSATACPGASRKRKSAGHSAQNDEMSIGDRMEGDDWIHPTGLDIQTGALRSE